MNNDLHDYVAKFPLQQRMEFHRRAKEQLGDNAGWNAVQDLEIELSRKSGMERSTPVHGTVDDDDADLDDDDGVITIPRGANSIDREFDQLLQSGEIQLIGGEVHMRCPVPGDKQTAIDSSDPWGTRCHARFQVTSEDIKEYEELLQSGEVQEHGDGSVILTCEPAGCV